MTLAAPIKPKNWLITLIAGVLIFAGTQRSSADDGWQASINVSRILQMDGFEALLEEMVGEDIDEFYELAESYSEVIGLNPFEDIKRIRIIGSADLPMDDDLDELGQAINAIIVDVNQTGNLEGLLLTLENYSSERVDGVEVHHFSVEELEDIYVAFIESGSGESIIITHSDDMMEEFIDGSPSDSGRSRRSSSDHLLSFSIDAAGLGERLMDEIDDDVPNFVGGLVGSISRIAVAVDASEDAGLVELVASIEVEDEERLDQLVQLASAGVALGKLALAEEDDEELEQLLELLDSVSIKTEDSTIEFKLEANLSDLMNTALDY